ncbi:alpha/beta hydrolase [Lichenihabitans sp. PAMC28606]|uniref:alpha/beta fold hydrolase n=1 Tax=Lichenihabitans sp. PAMC28606 TaxID=2880932 RepID=UPI001D0B92A4|nr:alpha/beta fold hydrolase [Lichenihabitans sp. PAMC28606]UDL93812.1 alpha/beta hydrolase [Lichenihabitans sp. PAMC28606]
MSAITIRRDDVVLQGFDQGAGTPLLFQHGLGGSVLQIDENVPDVVGIRRLTLDCRGQGGSTPGTARPFSIETFADDAWAFAEERIGAQPLIVGGISMGAAIALRLAIRHPGRVRGLILARPAWLFADGPETMMPYRHVAAALRSGPPAEARQRFLTSPVAAMLASEAPDNLASLLQFFERPSPLMVADLLDQIAADGPGVTEAEARALTIPTLVIGHAVDHAHPLADARRLAEIIPDARLAEIPPKAGQKAAHVAAFRAVVADFLLRFAA